MARKVIYQKIRLEGRKEIEAELKKLGSVGEAALKRLETAANRTTGQGLSRMDKALVGLRKQLDVVNSRVANLGNRFSSATRTIASAAGTLIGAFSARALVQMTDQYTSLANILAVVGDGQTDVNKTINDLNAIAGRTRSPLEAISTLYQRASIAAKELGADQKDLLRFTENIGLALAQTGGSGAAATGALLQLSQAIGGSVVRAEEFNSIQEGALPILQAAANGIDRAGGSIAKLRALVLEGSVTSKEFFEAILSQSRELEAAFAKTSPTIAQAFTVLNNNLLVFIGQADQASGISAGLAQAILFLARNIDVVVLGFTALFGAFALVKGVALAKDLISIGAALVGLIKPLAAVGIAIAANPLFLIPALLIAIVAGIITMTDSWDDAWKFLTELFSNIAKAVTDIGAEVQKAFDDTVGAVGAAFQAIYDTALSIANGIIKAFQDAAAVVAAVFGGGGGGGNDDDAPALKRGGHVRGAGTSTSDSIVARLSNGEFVMRAAAVKKWGVRNLSMLNQGRMPKFSLGGLVSGLTHGMQVPAVGMPAFADGGVVTPAGRPLTLNIGGETFEGLLAPEAVAEKLTSFATTRQVRRAGKTPSWYR